ncbi:MAG: 2OG-Fe dioxygenase family protein, partial [Chloroflexota bacterium]
MIILGGLMSDIAITRSIKSEIRDKGYSLVLAETISVTLLDDWQRLLSDYDNLPRDAYLPDNGLYRYRRYDSFYFHPASGDLVLMPHTDYFQSRNINHVTGGMVRKFAPLTEETRGNPFLHELIRFDFETFPLDNEAWANESWQVDVHQIYVVADVGAEGHPTPEGV